MFEVAVEHVFAAGHALRNYKGKCENVHGHNWRVRVVLEGEQLDSTGLLVDFLDIRALIDKTAAYLDHQFINDLPPFDKVNPSAENLARYFYEEISKGLTAQRPEAPVRVSAIKVWETDVASATYRP